MAASLLSVLNIVGNTLKNSVTNDVGGLGTLNNGALTTTITFSGVLTDGTAAGQLAFTQSGAGSTILTNSGNTYTGATHCQLNGEHCKSA